MNKAKSLCFTGHRAAKLPWKYDEADVRCVQMKETLRAAIEDKISQGVSTFYTGGQNGIDMIAGEVVIGLKRKYNIRLIVVLPFEGMANDWSEDLRQRFFAIMAACDEEVLLNHHFTSGCYRQRNAYMTSRCGHLIAVTDKSKSARSSTAQTINMARMRGLNIIEIPV